MWGALASLIPAAIGAVGAFQGARGRNNPGNAAQPYLNQIPGQGQQAYNPFIQSGQQAEQQLNPITSQFAQNPFDVYNNILGQYKPSQGYQYRQDKLTQGLHNTAASGGFAGTNNHQDQYGNLVNSLMGQDQQQFLQNILGIQGAGMEGLESRVGRGSQAAGGLADYLGNAGQMQATNAYQGQSNKNAARGQAYSSLASLIGGGMGAFGGTKTPSLSGGSNSMNFARGYNPSNPFLGRSGF